MKIGDEVYVHGHIDEIRKDVVIIRNEGGYFGTVPCEIEERATESAQNVSDSDLISRKAAMLAITERMEKVKNPCGSGEMFWEGLCIARSIVGDLPSAQPENIPQFTVTGGEPQEFVPVVRCKDCKI